jgi:dimethylargininase
LLIALTHVPSPKIALGERTHIARAPIDFDRAVHQHADYCAMLRRLGVEVRTLDVNQDQADCVFIEDTALVLDELAVLSSMGARSRWAEPLGIEPVLREYREVYPIKAPATLEGGDVVPIERTLLVGFSSRTNNAGIQALKAVVGRYEYRVIPVTVGRCLHLKTACTALPNGKLLVNPALLDMNDLRPFEIIAVPEEEPWAADVLSVGQRVCLPAEHTRTADMLRAQGLQVETIDLSEFAKAEGGITCLSLLFE